MWQCDWTMHWRATSYFRRVGPIVMMARYALWCKTMPKQSHIWGQIFGGHFLLGSYNSSIYACFKSACTLKADTFKVHIPTLQSHLVVLCEQISYFTKELQDHFLWYGVICYAHHPISTLLLLVKTIPYTRSITPFYLTSGSMHWHDLNKSVLSQCVRSSDISNNHVYAN